MKSRKMRVNKFDFLLLWRINILVGLICIFTLSSCVNTNPIQLHAKKTKYAIDVGYGVFLTPSNGLFKGKTFNGLQAKNYGGSIEVLLDSEFNSLKGYYSKNEIEKRNGNLQNLQKVRFGQNEQAFYVEFYDKQFLRQRMALVIKQKDKTYHLKGFSKFDKNHPVSNKIRKAILSVYLSDFEEEIEPYSDLFFRDLTQNQYFTRDNKWPTEASDSSYIRIQMLEKNSIQSNDIILKDYLKNEVLKIGEVVDKIQTKILEDAIIYQTSSVGKENKIVALILLTKTNEIIYGEIVGNNSLDIKQAKQILLNRFIKVI